MRAIGRMPDMPSAHTIYNWMLSNESFFQQYAQACEIDAEIEFDSLIELADQSTAKTAVADKLKIDTRKWVLSKRIPKKYGDKQQLEHSGTVEGQLIIVRPGSSDADGD